MTPIIIQGVDYSRGGFPSPATLLANDKHFAVRYLVDDPSPTERGLIPGEYLNLQNSGVQVVAVWEGEASWMLGGFAAGQYAARNAEYNISRVGMPASIPVYFACDIDATEGQQAAIDDCLRGCAAVMGIERVGIYGGYWVVMRAKQNKTATWFWQTSAWSGSNRLEGMHLFQYDYNLWFDGVNCDATEALTEHYGQAGDFINGPWTPTPNPKPLPKPKWPTPVLPTWWKQECGLQYPTNRHFGDSLWEASRGKSTVVNKTEQRMTASVRGKRAGETLMPGDIIARERVFTAGDGKRWVILRSMGKGREGARVLHSDLSDTPINN